TKAQYILNGKYVDITESPIPFANVLLLNKLDSTLVKGTITDESGDFSLMTERSGRFLIAVKHLGFEDYYSKEFLIDEANPKYELGSILADERSQQLDSVLINAEKPLFEQKIDR